jgi:hypothetical protein
MKRVLTNEERVNVVENALAHMVATFIETVKSEDSGNDGITKLLMTFGEGAQDPRLIALCLKQAATAMGLEQEVQQDMEGFINMSPERRRKLEEFVNKFRDTHLSAEELEQAAREEGIL